MRIFFSFTILCKHTCMYLHLQTYLHARVCVRSFYKREENRESETIKVVQSNKWKKKKKKLEKKKRKRIDACTVYFHHFWILCTLTLLIYGIFVDVYRTTKREIGGQPFNDTIRSLFFFSQWLRCSFVARPCYVCIIIGRNVAHEKYLFNIFFSSYFGGMQMHLRGTFWHE